MSGFQRVTARGVDLHDPADGGPFERVEIHVRQYYYAGGIIEGLAVSDVVAREGLDEEQAVLRHHGGGGVRGDRGVARARGGLAPEGDGGGDGSGPATMVFGLSMLIT